MAILVVGGNGYTGIHILRELLRRGEKPISYDINPPPREMEDIEGDVKILRGDVLSPAELFRVIKEEKIDHIVHLVSMLTQASQNNPYQAFRVNVGSLLNLLEGARIFPIRRLVYVSSFAVYGKTSQEPVEEDYPKEPMSVYGLTKLTCEHLGLQYHQTFNVDFLALRWPVIWGPGQGTQAGKSGVFGAGKFADILEKPFREQPVKIPGGSQPYEILYVKDAARAVALALFHKSPAYRIYNIGCETLVTLQELAFWVKEELPGASIEVLEGFDFADPCRGPLHVGRAKSDLGFESEFKPRKALQDYLNTLRQERR